MSPELKEKLRELAKGFNYTHSDAKAHVSDVWHHIHGKGPARLSVVDAAWEIVPGTYSYYDTARALEIALRETEG